MHDTQKCNGVLTSGQSLFFCSIDSESSDESLDELDLSASFFVVDESDEAHTPTGGSTNQEKPLYYGAPEGLTESMAHMLVFQYSTRHSLTD